MMPNNTRAEYSRYDWDKLPYDQGLSDALRTHPIPSQESKTLFDVLTESAAKNEASAQTEGLKPGTLDVLSIARAGLESPDDGTLSDFRRNTVQALPQMEKQTQAQEFTRGLVPLLFNWAQDTRRNDLYKGEQCEFIFGFTADVNELQGNNALGIQHAFFQGLPPGVHTALAEALPPSEVKSLTNHIRQIGDKLLTSGTLDVKSCAYVQGMRDQAQWHYDDSGKRLTTLIERDKAIERGEMKETSATIEELGDKLDAVVVSDSRLNASSSLLANDGMFPVMEETTMNLPLPDTLGQTRSLGGFGDRVEEAKTVTLEDSVHGLFYGMNGSVTPPPRSSPSPGIPAVAKPPSVSSSDDKKHDEYVADYEPFPVLSASIPQLIPPLTNVLVDTHAGASKIDESLDASSSPIPVVEEKSASSDIPNDVPATNTIPATTVTAEQRTWAQMSTEERRTWTDNLGKSTRGQRAAELLLNKARKFDCISTTEEKERKRTAIKQKYLDKGR